MKISRKWLQAYFDAELPQSGALAEALTFHVAEVEEVAGDSMEVKVLPDRAAYLLCHRGIAKELSAILQLPLKKDPLAEAPPSFPSTDLLQISIDTEACLRHTGALVRGVRVGSSPPWLKEALESVGQRSINNIVDITNYLTLDIGQPMHAFDAKKISLGAGPLQIDIRRTKGAERVTILTSEEYELPEGTLVIAEKGGRPLDIAGIKGGQASGITEDTTDLFVSVGNYDGVLIRRTAHALKLFTDASQRYQNKPSPELTGHGMREALKMFTDIAGGEVIGVVDIYPRPPAPALVEVTIEDISKRLGAAFSKEKIGRIFERLGFSFTTDDSVFSVTPPFERKDIVIAEDLAEEVGRINGYDALEAVELPSGEEVDQFRFRGVERMKDMLVEKGFIEVSTQSFAKTGDIYLANPLDKTKPALRTTLEEGIRDALIKAKQYSPLILGSSAAPKIFEVGTVFPKEGEFVALQMSEKVSEWGEAAGTSDNLSVARLEEYGKEYIPIRPILGRYQPFSLYPFANRDIAFWCPENISAQSAEVVVRESGGVLLARLDLFDTFKKEGRISYAFRLILQAHDHTLSEEEIASTIKKIEEALGEKDWKVR